MINLPRKNPTVWTIAIFSLLSGALSLQAQDRDVASGTTEHVTKIPQKKDDVLGTKIYSPSEKEKPYFQKLAPKERHTGGLAGDYDISKKNSTYVGWFGVVRQVEEHEGENQTVLVIEHKYFDGFTDTHIQAVSFNGSGDFSVVFSGVGHEIKPLTLVKVYGVATLADPRSKPEVKAEFVRVWHWGTFTFLFASGEQRGSEKWRTLNSVELDHIYDPYPDDKYYKRRLGNR